MSKKVNKENENKEENSKKGNKKITNKKERYIYSDEEDNPLYRVTRYYDKEGNKSFFFERYEEGKYIKGLKEFTQRVLFYLPLVRDAVENSEKIYFVEGEKDVNTLYDKGKTATTIAGRSK